MSRSTCGIPYGADRTLEVNVPEGHLMGVYSPRDVTAAPDVKAEIARALAHPIGSPPLAELAKGKRNVVLVADDNTRLTPTDILIPPLLDELNAAGVPDEKIRIIIALGTHRFMTDEEILVKFGPETVRRVVIKNHPYKDPDSLVDLGRTANGTAITINKDVVEADFKIGIGSIVPHHIPGFAGGAKIVQPGVSGEITTAETHLLSVREKHSYLGTLDNPVRRELNLIARKVGLNTIFNTVLNYHGEVVAAYFGDVEAAFVAGAARAKEVYSVVLPAEADIVISGSYPCDLEFWQAHKTLYPAERAVRRGGIIIVVTPCYEGVAVNHAGMAEFAGLPPDEVRRLLAEGKIDPVAAALAIAWGQVREQETVYFVSEGISAAEARKLGFVPFDTVQEALDAALAASGPRAQVAVLTHAPDMLPVIQRR
jgi:lactate racemase